MVISSETFTYDAAGNITSAPDVSFQYDTNNRLVSFNGNSVSYDLDGNMLNNGADTYTYDSANRLITAGGHTYTYNAEDIRIRDLCLEEDTAYTYNNNCKLSKLLMKTSGSTVTKYVYGRGLIGEETGSEFKTYHFDCRGSTVAITDISGNITDNIDKYTTVAVSLSAGFGASISAGYIITTTDDYNNAVTTSIELKHVASKPPSEDNGPQPTGRPVLKPQPGPAPGYAYEYDWEYADEYEPSLEAEQYAYDAGPVLKFFVAIFATVGAGIAIGETFASYGAGAWNDPAAVATAVEA